MKILLDTHAFIWWNGEPARLPPEALSLLRYAENTVFVSFVSIWEIQIKTQLGKLALPYSLEKMVEVEQTDNQLIMLPIQLNHILALNKLPYLHKDPFDRLLIAQAVIEEMAIVTKDKAFDAYPVKVIWN